MSSVVCLLLAASAPAADKTAADLLPASIVAYLEVPQSGKVVDLVLDHPLTAEVIKAPEYQQALQTPQYQKFAGALKQFEDRLGMKWREAVGGLTSGGLTVGFDLPTRGP